jgi:hypothetical protein
MELHGVVTSDSVEGYITDFGLVSPDKPLILSERRLRMIEKKRRKKIGEIQMPVGTTLTIVLEGTDEEEE